MSIKHLPYEIGALEPCISGLTMEMHYGKHHRTYVKNLNDLLEKQAEAAAQNKVALALSYTQAIKFNGGGHVNHELFWESMCPEADSEMPQPGSPLHDAFVDGWGSMETFFTTFNGRTAAIQGSGWGWLVYNKKKDTLSFRVTTNQDMISDVNADLVPIVNVDVWEHAYYLDYRNSRPNYLNNFWKIVNWKVAEERYLAARISAGHA